jgi:hypothetical protein
MSAPTSAPTRVTQWKEFIRRLLATDGYVVQGSSDDLPIGSSVRMFGSDQPFRITATANHEAALRQWQIYQEITGEEMEPPAPASEHWHYFKVSPAA